MCDLPTLGSVGQFPTTASADVPEPPSAAFTIAFLAVSIIVGWLVAALLL
jgi:hypothetical protein